MRKTNDRRRNHPKTHYHNYHKKIAANPDLFPCQTATKMYNVAQSIQESLTFAND